MWQSVLLTDQLVVAFIKSALATGHIHLREAASQMEADAICRLKSKIARSRSTQASMMYSLLADRVWLDSSDLGIPLLESGSNVPVGPAFCHLSSEVAEVVAEVKSARDYASLEARHKWPDEIANDFAVSEPLLWRKYKQMARGPFTRQNLRDALDLMCVSPMLIVMARSGTVGDAFIDEVTRAANSLNPASQLSRTEIVRHAGHIHLVARWGIATAGVIAEAKRLNAVLPISKLTLGRSRYRAVREGYYAIKSDEVICATRVFLKEIRHWPAVNDLDDVLRVRGNSGFIAFRSVLREWVGAVLAGDGKAEMKLRTEIGRANRALRKSVQCGNVGRFMTYFGLPLIVLDALTIPVFGAPITVSGFALQAYADWQSRKSRWLIVGA